MGMWEQAMVNEAFLADAIFAVISSSKNGWKERGMRREAWSGPVLGKHHDKVCILIDCDRRLCQLTTLLYVFVLNWIMDYYWVIAQCSSIWCWTLKLKANWLDFKMLSLNKLFTLTSWKSSASCCLLYIFRWFIL